MTVILLLSFFMGTMPMELYRIKTMGREYRQLPDDGSELITVTPSERYDFALSFKECDEIFLPDVMRAFAAYLKYVRGYPIAEYEVLTPCGIRTVRLHMGGLPFCTEVRGCRVLAEKRCVFLEWGELSAFEIETPMGVYRAVICSDATAFDMRAAGSALMRCKGSGSFARGVIALSLEGQRASIRATLNTPKPTVVPDSCAFAAAAVLITEGRKACSMQIAGEEEITLCKRDYLGSVSVFSSFAEVSRIYPGPKI